jgi:chromosome segregation ATPase
MNDTNPTAEEIPQMQLDEKSQQLLSNTDSTVHQTYEDLKDIGEQVDYSKMTLSQLRSEFGKFRKEHEAFKWEVREIIAMEIERQVKPLVEQMEKLTAQKPRFIYVKLKVPFVDFLKTIYAKIKK